MRLLPFRSVSTSYRLYLSRIADGHDSSLYCAQLALWRRANYLRDLTPWFRPRRQACSMQKTTTSVDDALEQIPVNSRLDLSLTFSCFPSHALGTGDS